MYNFGYTGGCGYVHVANRWFVLFMLLTSDNKTIHIQANSLCKLTLLFQLIIKTKNGYKMYVRYRLFYL